MPNPLTESQLMDALNAAFPGRNWNGHCQAVIRNASELTGGFRVGYLTATAAWRASSIASFDPRSAPAGAIHYWDIPDPDGHVALDLSGGGRRLLHGAPSSLSQSMWGWNLGVASFAHIAALRPGWSYRGWSYSNGLNLVHLTGASAAAASITPFSPEEDVMIDSMCATVDGVPSWCWLNDGGGVFAVHTQEEANWVVGYMGPIRSNWFDDPIGGEKYKNRLAMHGILGPKNIEVVTSGGTVDYERIRAMVDAGVSGALDGLTATTKLSKP